MSEIRIVQDAYGRPHPVRVDELYQYAAGSSPEIDDINAKLGGGEPVETALKIVLRSSEGADGFNSLLETQDADGNYVAWITHDGIIGTIAGEISSNYASDTAGSSAGLYTYRARGTEQEALVVQSGDALGELISYGYDGANYKAAGGIHVESDGTPGTNDMPGRVSIYTTPDGSAQPVERLRVTSTGAIVLGAGGTGPQIRFGAGSPESVVTAPVGSMYLNTSGGASTTLYIKTSGTGNTGWTAK